MNYYRISKYNPDYRIGSIYMNEEWTDFSDVGKYIDGQEITLQRYLEVESNYLEFISCTFSQQAINFYIKELEIYDSSIAWESNQVINKTKVLMLSRDCLRNRCWCKIESSNDAYLHFGYDYYIYIGCNMEYEEVNHICKKLHLFIERMKSPYHL